MTQKIPMVFIQAEGRNEFTIIPYQTTSQRNKAYAALKKAGVIRTMVKGKPVTIGIQFLGAGRIDHQHSFRQLPKVEKEDPSDGD